MWTAFLTFDKNRLDISRENDYASSTAQVEPWFLWYCFALYETNCYDGDRCDMDVEREYLCLRLFSGEELEKARANAPASLKEQRGCQPYLIQSFCERIPERIPSGIPEGSCFADWIHLYLEHPYHYAYNLCIYVYRK